VNRNIRRLGELVIAVLVAATPAFAQIDLSGQWSGRFHEDQEHRVPGPELGDYTGLPINDAARMKADSWDASILSLREHQAKPHPAAYSLRGPANIRISRVLDTVTQATIGWELFGTFGQATRTIYTDGRARPPSYAAHTWAGFSVGRWDGDQLTVETTHLKVGWIQRNGVAHSDRTTMTEHFFRHGEILTVVTVVKDPIYLEEPFVRSTSWMLDPRQDVLRTQFDIVDEVSGHPKGYVPHYVPGSSGFEAKKTEFAQRKGLPLDAVRGGAATTRPEWRAGTPTSLVLRNSTSSGGPSRPPFGRPDDGPTSPEIMHVQGNVWMLVGAGGNIAVQIGDEGVLLVDTGRKGMSDEVLKAIRTITDKPLRIIINTSAAADHTGGNEPLAKIGRWLAGNAPGNGGLPTVTARVIAHERALFEMKDRPFAEWPTETFTTDKEIFFNGEPIVISHQPSAIGSDDVTVFFRRSDVVVSGDVFSTVAYPAIKGGGPSTSAQGAPGNNEGRGSVQGVIDALNRIIDITIPKDHEEGGTYVIPGHGRLCDEADVVEYRDMLTIIRDRVKARAPRPTLDYDARYGAADALIAAAVSSAASGRPAR
jgi:glyoxylase-like metal-dependent hydrolase (beta-lactamase superfamily II)